ncbi:MAG: hypothetical protein ABSE80_05820 [Halobacteriota archaeon]|jgi:hypothetical protein
MTICIAAVGQGPNNKELIVFATDHMISHPMGQFEMTLQKYKMINDNTAAMLAGDPLIFDTLIKDCTEDDHFDGMAQKIQNSLNGVKNEAIQKQLLDRFKLDFNYLKEVLRGPIQNPFLNNMLESVVKFTLNTVVILIGFKEDEAQITEIGEVKIANVRDISFDAVGSGSVQATNTLLFQRHSKNDSLATTIYDVYKAKRNAEVAQGVGKETDLMVLYKSGLEKIDEARLKDLDGIYAEELKLGRGRAAMLKWDTAPVK